VKKHISFLLLIGAGQYKVNAVSLTHAVFRCVQVVLLMAGKGGPKGKYSETHGIVTLRNQIKRRTKRGRSFIDMRSHSGQNAVAV